MQTYAIRMVIRWAPRPEQTKKYIYEERITAWAASSFEDAIDAAEKEAHEYAASLNAEALDLFQAYHLVDNSTQITNGTEVFSLLRDSDLEASEYLDLFFDTGAEREGSYIQRISSANDSQ